MLDLVRNKLTEVRALCREHHVIRLALVGSAVDGSFDPRKSDLDFLVQYEPDLHMNLWDHYWGLKEGLEQLFDRKVDLIDRDALRNPYVIKSLLSYQEKFYAAA